MKYLLASTSPRRKELLKYILSEFEIASPHFDESTVKIKNAKRLVKKLAYEKSKAVFSKSQGDWCVIGADTVVALGDEIIGKPNNTDDAKKILKKLAGKKHHVHTGVCVLARQGEVDTKINFVVSATIYFEKLDEKEIEKYILTGEPADKAGAYAIQGYGGKFIKKIKGSYHAIVGLPIAELYQVLRTENLLQ